MKNSNNHIPTYLSSVSVLQAVLVILLAGFSVFAYSQNAAFDSVEIVIKEETDPNIKLKALSHQMANGYRYRERKKALTRLPDFDRLLSESNDVDAQCESIIKIGITLYRCNESAKGLDYLKKCEPLLGQISDDDLKYRFHTTIAYIYETLGDFEKASKNHDLAINFAQATGKHKSIGAASNNAGTMFLSRSNKPVAKGYFEQAVISFREDGTVRRWLATALNNLSKCEEDVPLHNKYWNEAYDIRSSYNDTSGMVSMLCGHSIYLHDRNFTTDAHRYSEQAVALGSDLMSIDCWINYAQILLEQNKLKQAQKTIESIVTTFDPDSVYVELDQQAMIENIQSEYYAKIGDYENAYAHLFDRYVLFDSMEYSSNAKHMSEFHVKYETLEKEKELIEKELVIEQEQSKRRSIINYGLLGAGLLALFALLFIQSLRRKRREAQYQLRVQELESASLKSLDEMKSRWFENIAHDIRTPLTLISAPIKDLLKITRDKSSQKLLTIADRNSQHLLSLTNEMLELARLESNVIPLQNQCRLVRIDLQKMIYAFDSFAAECQVDLISHINISNDDIRCFDYDKYEKIFNNLLKNAIQYSPRNTTVSIHVDIVEDNLITKIVDQGPGLSKSERQQLFNKYFRADHEQNKRVLGSGLGLAIVNELVELMNGTIAVESELQVGSTFTFTIPTSKSDVSAAIATMSESDDEQANRIMLNATKSMRILLVEDNKEMQDYLQMVLSLQFSVDVAENAHNALQLLVEPDRFDLIISDIMMPGMDGFEFKKRVNNLSSYDGTPFIFLSAKALDKDRLSGLRLGVDDYITKPFITEELIVRIKNLLSRKVVKDDEPQVEEDSVSTSVVDRAISFVEQNLSNQDLSVAELAQAINYSQSQLNRILKCELGLTTVQLILELRLQRAHQLLLSKEVYSIKEVQHRVGILSQSYFSRKYKERFGISPSDITK